MSVPPEPIPYDAVHRLGPLRWTIINSRRLIWRKGMKPNGALRRMEMHYHGKELVGWVSFYSSGDRLVSFHDMEEPRLCRATGEVIPLGAIDLPNLMPDRWKVRVWRPKGRGPGGSYVEVVPSQANGEGFAAEAVRPGPREPP